MGLTAAGRNNNERLTLNWVSERGAAGPHSCPRSALKLANSRPCWSLVVRWAWNAGAPGRVSSIEPGREPDESPRNFRTRSSAGHRRVGEYSPGAPRSVQCARPDWAQVAPEDTRVGWRSEHHRPGVAARGAPARRAGLIPIAKARGLRPSPLLNDIAMRSFELTGSALRSKSYVPFGGGLPSTSAGCFLGPLSRRDCCGGTTSWWAPAACNSAGGVDPAAHPPCARRGNAVRGCEGAVAPGSRAGAVTRGPDQGRDSGGMRRSDRCPVAIRCVAAPVQIRVDRREDAHPGAAASTSGP
jgi:hypothetical protein